MKFRWTESGMWFPRLSPREIPLDKRNLPSYTTVTAISSAGPNGGLKRTVAIRRL
jgi:hypothetical protein